MSEPLRLSYDWRRPLAMFAIPVVIVLGYAAISGSGSFLVLGLMLLVLYALYAVVVWLRTRAFLEVGDDDRLTTRRWFGFRTIAGADVAGVREVVQGRSPDVRLMIRPRGSVVVPTSKLERGHSTVFRWVADQAPQATLDKGAVKLRDRLRDEGLM